MDFCYRAYQAKNQSEKGDSMADEIYQKLAEHLDSLPQRYPTNTGTDLETKIPAHIFSPKEAARAVKL